MNNDYSDPPSRRRSGGSDALNHGLAAQKKENRLPFFNNYKELYNKACKVIVRLNEIMKIIRILIRELLILHLVSRVIFAVQKDGCA